MSGFEEILRIVRDPEDLIYKQFRYQLGDKFDPSRFDLRSAIRRLYDYGRTIVEVLHGLYER